MSEWKLARGSIFVRFFINVPSSDDRETALKSIYLKKQENSVGNEEVKELNWILDF